MNQVDNRAQGATGKAVPTDASDTDDRRKIQRIRWDTDARFGQMLTDASQSARADTAAGCFEALSAPLESMARAYGFSKVLAGIRYVDHNLIGNSFCTFSGYDPAFLERYDDENMNRYDPYFRYAEQVSPCPFSFDEVEPRNKQELRVMRELEAHGVSDGFGCVIKGVNGSTVFLFFAGGDQDVPVGSRQYEKVSQAMIYFAAQLNKVFTAIATKYSQRDPASIAESLSERERDVLTLRAQGLTPSEIAEQLHISPKTVQRACGRAKEKLDASDFDHAAYAAIRLGIIDMVSFPRLTSAYRVNKGFSGPQGPAPRSNAKIDPFNAASSASAANMITDSLDSSDHQARRLA